MNRIILSGLILVFLCLASSAPAEENKKDIYGLSYLCGYKCYNSMAGRVMLDKQYTFKDGYKKGFGNVLAININISAFDEGFQDARNRIPSKYKEEILQDLFQD